MRYMIYRLEIENFYSFRDPQVLELRIPKSVQEFPERFAPVFSGSEQRTAKVVALFGANGSGKSTVLKALAFISWFLRESFQHRGSAFPCERFNDEESANKEVRIAVEFGGLLDLSDTSRNAKDSRVGGDFGTYRYELHFQPKGGVVRMVSHEALRMKRDGQGKWQRVFERGANRSVVGSKMFSLSRFAQVVDKIREDASVVATLALFEHEASKTISDVAARVFRNILFDRADPADQVAIDYFVQNPEATKALNRELQRIDVGVEEMFFIETSTGPLPKFRHKGLHIDMPWLLESHGTRSFIRVFPFIFLALLEGGVAVIDELDQSIHPLVLPEIVRWFYDAGRNPHNAQLWMSCHSASLLDDLMKEEVAFCEKDSDGRSHLYSLMDVGGKVRRTDNLYKKYLGGVYGAIPQVG